MSMPLKLAFDDHALIARAATIPLLGVQPVPVMSFSPVILKGVPGRPLDLLLRVSVPAAGPPGPLPVVLLSHGQGVSYNLSSLNGYAPLVQYWAARGFAVLQPTHLSSRALAVPDGTPGAPLFWRERVNDMTAILDRLDDVQAAVPFLVDRGGLDASRVAVVGHSMGAHTAAVLLGMRLKDPDSDFTTDVDLRDARIRAGILLAGIGDGNGGKDLSAFANDKCPFMRHSDYSTMAAPALVVAGADDISPHLTTRGADWHADPFRLSPAPKSLATIADAWHCLGGISGFDTKETRDDESPERIAAVQRLTTAYLRKVLCDDSKTWDTAAAAFSDAGLGTVEEK